MDPQQATSLAGHSGAVHSALFSRDGRYCLTGGADRSVRLWSAASGLCIKTYDGHGKDVLGLALPHAATDNNRFASCGMDRSVIVWDVGTGRAIRKFGEHTQRVNALDFNSDASVLASGSYDATVRIWDCRAQTWRPVQVLDGPKDSVEAVQILGHEILTGCVDGVVRVYDVRAGRLTSDRVGRKSVTSARFSNDGKCILTSTLDDTIRLFDNDTGDLLNEYKGHTNRDYRIVSTLSYDDAQIVSGSEDGQVFVWDLVEGNVVRSFKAHAKTVTCVAYHPKAHAMVTTSLDGTVKLWS
ncbi:WD40-repeat-containing domain protein [Entophlyctis helioformis]|nr:WD40-repeat-containing domain protein [Entophlyctis helioformis]